MVFVTNPFVAGGLFMMEGVVVVIWNVITVSARQALVPAELFGRVNSVYRFVGWGVLPVGALLGGVVAQAFGLRAPFVIAAITLVVLVLWARRIVTRAAFDTAFEAGRPVEVDMLEILDENDAPPPTSGFGLTRFGLIRCGADFPR